MKYIEQEIALGEIDDWMEEYPTGEAYDALRHVKRAIARIPESDVRPVVRCRDCIHRGDGEKVDDACWCYETSHVVGPEDFCSHGKREVDDGGV